MKVTEYEKKLYGNSVKIISRVDHCVKYKILSDTGYAMMTSYSIFPGIDLIYNDVHMQEMIVDTVPPANIFEINHCREGRIECQFNQGAYLYIARGDLVINLKDEISRTATFPLSYYHGITLAIDLDRATDELSHVFEEIKIDLYALKEKLCGDRPFVVLKESERIRHIFSELYEVPEEIRQGYFKLKVMEILLILSATEYEYPYKKYCLKRQVDTIKEIREYLTTHLEQKITIEQLATKYGMSATTMKRIFKEVYGDSIYAFIKEYKMQKAAILLKETDLEIGEIAIKMGYDNASKFSEAFKKIFGSTPRTYRHT